MCRVSPGSIYPRRSQAVAGALCLGLSLLLTVPLRASVMLGSDVLAAEGFKPLRGKRVALLTNQTGVNRHGESTIDLLRRAPGVKLVALMAPEHGLDGEVPAGKEYPNSTDPRTGLPVYSLYGPGPVRQPTRAMLKGIDAVVYDVQDVGYRAYTFISTMGLAMNACGAAGVEFVVLDRPDPLGGERVEGPMLNPHFRSFVGRWPIPYVYGMTCGELALMINGQHWIAHPCRLRVIPMYGWKRSMTWRDTGLKWVPTSPNVPTPSVAMGLVATALVGELGGLSTGLGTSHPYQFLGATWLEAKGFSNWMASYLLPGVRFVPTVLRPKRGAFKGLKVHGALLRFTNPARAPLLAINFYALEAADQLGRRNLFAAAVKRGHSFAMFDKVNGTDATRKALAAGKSAASIVRSWRAGEAAFRRERKKYLLY